MVVVDQVFGISTSLLTRPNFHFLPQRINPIHDFFISNSSVSSTRLKLAKNQTKAKQHPEAGLMLFEDYFFPSSVLSSKNNRKSCKKCAKNKCVCFSEIIWSIIKKRRLKMKNKSRIYSINRLRPRHGHKYTLYIMCFSMMMVICIELYVLVICMKKLSNIETEFKKRVACIKKRIIKINKCKYCKSLGNCSSLICQFSDE